MRKTPEQRLAEIERQRARLSEKIRADRTREKIVLGAAIAAEMRDNADFADAVRTILLKRVKRDADRRAVSQIVDFSSAPPPQTLETQTADEGPQSDFADPLAGIDFRPRRRPL